MSAREQIWPSFNGVRIWSEAGKGSRAKVVEKGGERDHRTRLVVVCKYGWALKLHVLLLHGLAKF